MIAAEFKGHALSNAASAYVFHYPKISGGSDLYKDLTADAEGSTSTLLKIYAAFRMAADPEARKSSPEELVNEVNIFDPSEAKEFMQVMNSLLNEKSQSPKKEPEPEAPQAVSE